MIRIIRVLEYTYPNAHAMEIDEMRWQVPPTGTKRFGSDHSFVVIRSATLPLEVTNGEQVGEILG